VRRIALLSSFGVDQAPPGDPLRRVELAMRVSSRRVRRMGGLQPKTVDRNRCARRDLACLLAGPDVDAR
jgi:hypothetical protein